MTVQYHSRLHGSRALAGLLGLLVLTQACTADLRAGTPAADGPGALGGGTGSGGAPSGPGSGGAAAVDSLGLRDFSRLTRIEFVATVSSALGVSPDVGFIPEDGRIGPFTSNVGVTPDPVHPYLLLAEELAAELIPAELPACEASAIDSCLTGEYQAPLELLFRRPLADSELSTWSGIVEEVLEAGGDSVQATRAMLSTALVSPDFLFRASPSSAGENAWARHVGEWLGYTLWDAPPDAALRDVATGPVTGLRSSLRDEASRLAGDARAVPVLARFFGQWLDVDTDLRQDEDDDFATSPDYIELLGFVEEAIASDVPVTDFVGGSWGIVHPDNTDLYGAPATDDIERVDWPADSLRRGLLGQELFAGSTRHPDAGRRPIFRGLLVLRGLLCEKLPLPDPTLVALAGEVEDRTVDERCASCHQHIDPIGYAFAALDPEFEGDPPEATVLAHAELAGTHDNVAALLEAVASSRAFAECFSRQWLAFFLEQEMAEVSGAWVSSLADSVEAGASLQAVIEQTALELAARSETRIPWCEGE
jgi:hypothetical protein